MSCTPEDHADNITTSVNNNINQDCCNSMDITMEPSYPNYYREYMNSERTQADIVAYFKQSDWITQQLLEEIMFHAPTKADMTMANGLFIKSKHVFEKNVMKLFRYDRIFVNYRQLDQYLTMFLES